MNTRTKTILIAAAFAAASSALGSQAADNDASAQAQSGVTDGYYSQGTASPAQDSKRGESAHTAAESAWLIRERIADSNGSKPVPFVEPAPTPASDSTASR